MRVNPGRLPVEAVGKRVRVMLAGGRLGSGGASWAADGRGGCRWSLTGSPFDIERYEVLG